MKMLGNVLYKIQIYCQNSYVLAEALSPPLHTLYSEVSVCMYTESYPSTRCRWEHTYILNVSLVVSRIVSRERADGRRGRLVGQPPLVELLQPMALLHHALGQSGQGTVLIMKYIWFNDGSF